MNPSHGQQPNPEGPRPGVPAPSSAAAPGDLPPELANHPRYQVLRELGRGGMGVVYQARQTVMNRPVVIKVISRALLDRPESLERFRREVRAAASLSHPNIVMAYDAEQAGDLHLLVMEFVPGQNLAEVLRKKGPLPVREACHYARQAALGLQHAFERGMVHRDIKPSNLMLTPKGQVKVLDFGLAKLASERGPGKGLTALNAYVGTPEYSAPEQAQDARSADTRADIYSLGCTLYCLLAGRPPFREDTDIKTILAHLEKEAAPLHALRREVPPELSAVVAKMLAKDPRGRQQTPGEVARALAPFLKKGRTTQPPPAAPRQGRPAAHASPARFAESTAAAAPDSVGRPPDGAEPAAQSKVRQGLIAAGAVLALVLLAAGLVWYGHEAAKGPTDASRAHPVPAGTHNGDGPVTAALPGPASAQRTGREEEDPRSPPHGKEANPPAVPDRPEAPKGQLVLTGLLEGDGLSVDGKPARVPAAGPDGTRRLEVPAGRHALTVTRPKRGEWTDEVMVEAGKPTSVAVELKVPGGTLVLDNVPRGARVLLDGKDVALVVDDGGSSQPLPLEAGTHGLEIRADGFAVCTDRVLIEADRTRHYRAALVAVKEANPKEPDRITQAVRRAVAYVKQQQQPDGSWQVGAIAQKSAASEPVVGATALCGLALLEAGKDAGVTGDDPAVAKAAAYVRQASLTATGTYSLSLGILFLDRLGDPADAELIESMAVRLLAGQDANTGGWGYSCPMLSDAEIHRLRTGLEGRARFVAEDRKLEPKTPKGAEGLSPEIKQQLAQAGGGSHFGSGDNSNTQFAILALWVARRQGIPVEGALTLVDRRFRRTQNRDGGWQYEPTGTSSPSMTCAGLLGLALGHGSGVEAARRGAARRPAWALNSDPAITKGMQALGRYLRVPFEKLYADAPTTAGVCYFLFSVERVGVAYGLDRVGGVDWYQAGSEYLLRAQKGDGSWMDKNTEPGADTCFALLFLRKANLAQDLSDLLRGKAREATLKAGGVGADGLK